MPGATRRRFLILFGASTTGLVGASCGPASAPASQPTSAPAAVSTQAPAAVTQAPGATQAPASAKPQPKVQRLVLASAPPAQESNNSPVDLSAFIDFQLRPMYESLIGQDPTTGKRIPELAERWEVEPNGKDWRFFLRRGVQFHNGFGEFTARDFVAWFEAVTKGVGAAGPSAQPVAADMRANVEGIDVINDYEFVFRYRYPSALVLYHLGAQAPGTAIFSKADLDSRGGKLPTTLTDKPLAGTGPWQYVERQQGQYLRFARVPYQHWRVGEADFPELELRWMPENSTRLAALYAGEVHAAALTREMNREAASRGFKIFQSSLAGIQVHLVFYGVYYKEPNNPASEELLHPDTPLRLRQVRQALTKAVDREALNRAFYEGNARPLHLFSRAPYFFGWDPRYEQQFPDVYGYDQAKARELLREAGVGPNNPLQIVMMAQPNPMNPEAPEVIEAVSTMYRAVGIEAPLQTWDPGTFTAKTRAHEFDRHLGFTASPNTDPLLQFNLYNTRLTANRTLAAETRSVDAGYEASVRELDEAKREQLFRDVGIVSYEYIPSVPLFLLHSEMAADPKVVGSYTVPGTALGAYSHYYTLKSA
jgi:peptide/nickel transport system substrate-binding protein